MENKEIVLSVTLDPNVAFQLAQFCKRSTYEMYYSMTEEHLPREERKARAYQMIAGIDAIRGALADAGIAPR